MDTPMQQREALLRALVGQAVTVLLPGGHREQATLYSVSPEGATLEGEHGDIMLVELHEIEVSS